MEFERHTQTNTSPGNCWQTAVACLLRVDPAELPDQVLVEAAGGSYTNTLQAYLLKHHRKTYVSLYERQFLGVMPRAPGLHLIEGPTVRTDERGIEHVVVGCYGEMVWDVHPSRAGLTKVLRWGLLLDLAGELLAEHQRTAHRGSWPAECLCPSCGGFREPQPESK